MSRIGKLYTAIPAGTDVSVADGVLVVKGPKGELRKRVHPAVTITVADGEAVVHPADDSRMAQALWGTFSSHVQNMVAGVNEGFEKQLTVEGVGYKANMQGDTLVLDVGFSHSVEMPVPEGLEVTAEKNMVTVKGTDKEKVGQFAADVRATKKPEPYKGKGVRYVGEVVRRKEGKRATA